MLAIVGVGSSFFCGACSGLRIAERSDTDASANDGSVFNPEPTADAQAPATPGGDAAPQGPRYDDTQKALGAKRFPGPVTAGGSKGYCTTKHLIWRDADYSLHSWTAATQARIDYSFKTYAFRVDVVPSATYIAVENGVTAQIDVYRTDQASSLVSRIPYSQNFVAASDGVILLDQRLDNGQDLGGTRVRRWSAGAGTYEDLTSILPTKEAPSSFVNDVLVIAGGYTSPFPLYLVDVVKKTTGSVIFDGAISLTQTEQGAGGLVVSYIRNGAGAALRVYKNNQDDPSSRFELGDDLANRAPYFNDMVGSPLEHKFLTRIASWRQKILYASAYGIWWYDLVTGMFAPVQLVAGKQTAIPDLMCVIRDANVLVYRMSNDAVGQVWAVPLTSL